MSQVVVDTAAMAPAALKFPNNFVANVHPDDLGLMRRAARELQFMIAEGAPRPFAGTTQDIGIYTNLQQHDPQALLQRFYMLLIARSNERKSKQGARHGNSNQSPRRRRHSVKAASRPRV